MPAPLKVYVVNPEDITSSETISLLSSLSAASGVTELTLTDSLNLQLQMLLELKKISLILQSSTMTFLDDSSVT